MFKARVMNKGISVYLGSYHTRERASVACKLYKHWLKKGVEPSFKDSEADAIDQMKINYYTLPHLSNIVIRVNTDYSLSFGYRMYHKKKLYSNYGYNKLVKAVKARDNIRKLIGLKINERIGNND